MKIAMFSFDPGLFEGSCQNNFGQGKLGGPALETFADSLRPLIGPYNVGIGITPIHYDFGGVVWPLLDTINTRTQCQVCIDGASSDNITQEMWYPGRFPWMQTHGISLQPSRVNSIMRHHGRRFGVYRSHELGYWLQYGIPQERGPNPLRYVGQDVLDRMPPNAALWQQSIIEAQIECCADNHVPYVWSEPWFSGTTIHTIQQTSKRFPGVIIPTYANNGGYTPDNYWPNQLQEFNGWPVAGCGLSIQSWHLDPTGQSYIDFDDLARWVNSAKTAGGIIFMQFEHPSALCNVPGYDPSQGGWHAPWLPSHDGSPKPALSSLIGMLL